MFRQSIVDGFQHEQPDYWLNFGNPWEIERLNVAYPIRFYGHVSVSEEDGRQRFKWNASETVSAHHCAAAAAAACRSHAAAGSNLRQRRRAGRTAVASPPQSAGPGPARAQIAPVRDGGGGGGVPQVTAVAYDNPIPGFNTSNTINLRLWAAKPDTEFDLEAFNTGDYVQVGALRSEWRPPSSATDQWSTLCAADSRSAHGPTRTPFNGDWRPEWQLLAVSATSLCPGWVCDGICDVVVVPHDSRGNQQNRTACGNANSQSRLRAGHPQQAAGGDAEQRAVSGRPHL